MTYAIVYDSKTGNTEQLARTISEVLVQGECTGLGSIDEIGVGAVEAADRIYVGFWTNRGDCSDEAADLLANLGEKEVFLFGTAGFGADETYFAGVVARVLAHVPETAHLIGSFMCQGRMPKSVRARYEQTMKQQPAQAERMKQLIANFDEAQSHPNEDDLARLRVALKAVE